MFQSLLRLKNFDIMRTVQSKMSASVWLILMIYGFVCPFNKGHDTKPNILFILTDDQDVAILGQYPLPQVEKLIAKQGMTFNNMFVTSPLCCPSRASILTGKYLHNTNVLNNSLSGGCASPTWQKQLEVKAIPTYMKHQGYETFYAGKYLNQYGNKKAGGVEHIPPGWDHWTGLVGNSAYYHYNLSVDGVKEEHGHDYKKDYLTDLIHRKASDFLCRRSNQHPFFMILSTPACHAPFTPAPQYSKNFTDKKAPRTKSFNVHGKNKHWLIERSLNPMPNDTIYNIDETFRNRWRTLLSVDDMVADLINQLKRQGQLDNTYIFYSADNGFHLGQFSLPVGKRQLYDFDIRVPLMVRGPGIKPGTTSEENVMSIDLAPTFADIAQYPNSSDHFDGSTLKPILLGQKHTNRSTVLIEYHGEHYPTIPGCPDLKNQNVAYCYSHCVCEDAWNNTYGCVRKMNEKVHYKYCALQDTANFVEMYDLKNDPYELENIAKTASPDLVTELSQELAYLSLCKGKTCHNTHFHPPVSN